MTTNVSIFKKSFRNAAMGVAVAAITAFGAGQVCAGGAKDGMAKDVTTQQGAAIAILDVNRIIAEAKAAKAVNSQMEKYQKDFQAEIKKQEQSLRDLNNQLVKDEKKLDAKAFEKKKADFDAKVAALQRTVMTRNSELQQAAQTSMERVRGAVVDISEKIRISRGFSLVLPSSFPVTYDPKSDITDEVIVVLNKQLPTINVKIAKVKTPAMAKISKAAKTAKAKTPATTKTAKKITTEKAAAAT
ncbi:MAG: OmpH family outer membrane protein [Pseudomonadota bacterium]